MGRLVTFKAFVLRNLFLFYLQKKNENAVFLFWLEGCTI
jgi:hypothetical protein